MSTRESLCLDCEHDAEAHHDTADAFCAAIVNGAFCDCRGLHLDVGGCTDCGNPLPHSHLDPRRDGDTVPKPDGRTLVWSGKRLRYETPERREQHERARCHPRGL